MAENELEILKTVAAVYSSDFIKGCPNYTKQTDLSTGETLDICLYNEDGCRFYDGRYNPGATKPEGILSQNDPSIDEGALVGLCRLQKDTLRIGPLILFDKRKLRPTPIGGTMKNTDSIIEGQFKRLD